MRSIISAIAATLRQSAYNLVMDCRDVLNRHVDFFYLEGQGGLFLKAPFLPLSAWAEWGQPHAGFGIVRGSLSIEPKIERNEA